MMRGPLEHIDNDGQRIVVYGTRISVYGSPSMTASDGDVAIGVDIPASWVEQLEVARDGGDV